MGLEPLASGVRRHDVHETPCEVFDGEAGVVCARTLRRGSNMDSVRNACRRPYPQHLRCDVCYLSGRIADAGFNNSNRKKAEIEAALGEHLELNPHPEKSDKIIRLTRLGDIADKSAWPEIIGWLTERAVSFK